MTIRSYFAGFCVLAMAVPSLASAAPAGATGEAARTADSGMLLAQIQAPPGGGGGGGPPPHARGGGGGGGGGGGPPPHARGGGGGGGGGGGPPPHARGGGGGGGGGVAIQRGGGDRVIQRGGGGSRFTVQDGGRRWIGRGDVRVRESWRRGDRWRYRSRPFVRHYGYYETPVVLYGGRRFCHRHYWRGRVLRHCHPYRYRWHRHGRWR
jgi:hypothetical protein